MKKIFAIAILFLGLQMGASAAYCQSPAQDPPAATPVPATLNVWTGVVAGNFGAVTENAAKPELNVARIAYVGAVAGYSGKVAVTLPQQPPLEEKPTLGSLGVAGR